MMILKEEGSDLQVKRINLHLDNSNHNYTKAEADVFIQP